MSHSEINDKLLILRARLGNKQAFADIYNKYVSKIYRFVLYKTTNKELAEDIVSHTFLKLWEKVLAGGQIRSLQALIYQIARNLVIDHYRASSTNKETPLEFDTESEPSYHDESIHVKLDQQLVRQAVDRMKNDDYKEIIILRYIEELSISEIAKITDKSKSNIATLSHRALQELRKILEEHI